MFILIILSGKVCYHLVLPTVQALHVLDLIYGSCGTPKWQCCVFDLENT